MPYYSERCDSSINSDMQQNPKTSEEHHFGNVQKSLRMKGKVEIINPMRMCTLIIRKNIFAVQKLCEKVLLNLFIL
jgi:hypothetical protein